MTNETIEIGTVRVLTTDEVYQTADGKIHLGLTEAHDWEEELKAIMEHTVDRAAGGLYCGDSLEMQSLVAAGLMESAGRKSFAPEPYFQITGKGRELMQL